MTSSLGENRASGSTSRTSRHYRRTQSGGFGGGGGGAPGGQSVKDLCLRFESETRRTLTITTRARDRGSTGAFNDSLVSESSRLRRV